MLITYFRPRITRIYPASLIRCIRLFSTRTLACGIIYEDMRQELESQLGAWGGKRIAKTEEEFCLILSKIFQSKRTQGVIGRMKAQSKDYAARKRPVSLTSKFPFKGEQNERFVALAKQ